MPTAKPSRSGPTIPETERRARGQELVQARCSEGTRQALAELAELLDVTQGRALEIALRSELDRTAKLKKAGVKKNDRTK